MLSWTSRESYDIKWGRAAGALPDTQEGIWIFFLAVQWEGTEEFNQTEM